MSSSVEEVLTDEDRALLGSIDDQIKGADDASEFEEIARDLRDRLAEYRAEHQAFKRNVEHRLTQLENGGVQSNEPDEDAPPIVHYANIPEGERGDLLSTSEQIAVTLHTEWSDIAWKMGDSSNRKVGVDTKTKANAKYNPSKLRHRLKEKVDRDLQANEIYRGLKRLAKLSGGEEHVNASDSRVHVTGGMYEYREMTTADKQDVKRVLWMVDE